ncbi:winged helix DNA-binding domain-containing protein [Aestuariimicrobium soli]|uniref:winged helix DNA-binding domain-containing protein n=1 Tax=Aestuariimicrobium soli TaxID=2035834 RepID=UPI003EB74673
MPTTATAPNPHLGRARLLAQGLLTRPYDSPHAAVAAHGAMQGQDLPGVVASAALRVRGGGVEAVIADLDAGRLVRGYPMRGTVFLMAADDVLWVQELCNRAMLTAQEKRRGNLGLEGEHVEQASELTQRLLADEPRGLERTVLMEHWAEAGLAPQGGRGYHVLSYLIGRGEVAFGPWNGSDQNVVPRAWLPAASDLEGRFNGDRVAAAAELLRRYLTSHGPATLRDFAWWTKLPQREIKPAFALVEPEVEPFECPGRPTTGGVLDTLWARPGLSSEVDEVPDHALLLPGFDEFILGYQDRLFAMTATEHEALVPGNNGVFRKTMVRDGRVVGTWTRGGRVGARSFETTWFVRETKKAAGEYQRLFDAFPFPSP